MIKPHLWHWHNIKCWPFALLRWSSPMATSYSTICMQCFYSTEIMSDKKGCQLLIKTFWIVVIIFHNHLTMHITHFTNSRHVTDSNPDQSFPSEASYMEVSRWKAEPSPHPTRRMDFIKKIDIIMLHENKTFMHFQHSLKSGIRDGYTAYFTNLIDIVYGEWNRK